MSEKQKRFDDLMKRVIKVTPEELRRRLKAPNRTSKSKPKEQKEKESNHG